MSLAEANGIDLKFTSSGDINKKIFLYRLHTNIIIYKLILC
jgi:hypothetical protein